MENLKDLTLVDLKKLANEKQIEFPNNIKKDDLIVLINGIEKTMTLDEAVKKSQEISEEIKNKTLRNENIVKQNKYHNERIINIKTSNIDESEKIKEISNINKIINENARQFTENTDKISKLNLDLIKIDETKNKLALEYFNSLVGELNKKKTEISLYPEKMANIVFKLTNEYENLIKEKEDIEKEVYNACDLFRLKYNNVDIEEGKLTFSEKMQLIRRFKDLSKINERMINR